MHRLRALASAACLLAAAPAAGADPAPAAPPTARATGLDSPSGREIYERVVAERFRSFEQQVRLVSGDRASNEQESRMTVLWKSFHDENGEPRKGVLSKTRIRYTHPFDLRFSGYLVLNNRDRTDDQFVYMASRRRVKRVNLRGEPVMGSDFSFEDVVPHELEDADYERLPDETFDGRPCHVVDVKPRASANSEYSHFQSWIDRERWVVLKTVYWDTAGVQVKELEAPADQVREFDGVWLPMRTRMRNIPLESYTLLTIDEMVANPDVDDAEFDPRRLESH